MSTCSLGALSPYSGWSDDELLTTPQAGRGPARLRPVPDARAEARVVPGARAVRAARAAGSALPPPRRRHAADALLRAGSFPFHHQLFFQLFHSAPH